MIREAEKVLLYYSFIEPNIKFIRHNENITFKVTTKPDDRSYLLRIHRPISEGLQEFNILRMDYSQKWFYFEK